MQTPERPFDGNAPGDGAPSYEWLDEWLCEYVDGTMDPSVEAVFEQYVEANPELKAHVERLRRTRELLGGCNAPDRPALDSPQEVSQEVEEELLQSPNLLPKGASGRSGVALGIVSSIVIALVVGFLAGSMLVDPDTLSSPPAVSTAEEQAPPQETVREEMPPRRPERSALPLRSEAPTFSVDESLPLRSETGTSSGPDTVRSKLSALGER